MPYQWTNSDETSHLVLWPHNALTPKGFTLFIAITCAMFSLPLLAALGSPILWGLLPFFAATVALTWYFLQRSRRDRTLREDLSLNRTEITLTRTNPKAPPQTWTANPYWVRLELDAANGPVENYLTLTGAGREVELGAFLTAQERALLHDDILHRLNQLDRSAGPNTR